MQPNDNRIETPHGTYQYDPDYDCYYRICTPEDLTHWNQFGWIYVCAVLTVIAYYVTMV